MSAWVEGDALNSRRNLDAHFAAFGKGVIRKAKQSQRAYDDGNNLNNSKTFQNYLLNFLYIYYI